MVPGGYEQNGGCALPFHNWQRMNFAFSSTVHSKTINNQYILNNFVFFEYRLNHLLYIQ